MDVEVTLNCQDCPLGPFSAVYQDDDGGQTDHETSGMLSVVAMSHRTAHPDHTATFTSEPLTEARERRRAAIAEDDANGRDAHARQDERQRARAEQAGTARASSGVVVYPWMD